MYELNPQYARVMSFAGDHPLFAHVRAQKRFGAILRGSSSFRSDRVRERHAKSHLYTLIQKNPVSLILGLGRSFPCTPLISFGGILVGNKEKSILNFQKLLVIWLWSLVQLHQNQDYSLNLLLHI